MTNQYETLKRLAKAATPGPRYQGVGDVSTPRKSTLTEQASALVYDMCQRINPTYVDQRGTESYERWECCEMIHTLLADLERKEADLVKHRELLVQHLAVLDPLRDAVERKDALLRMIADNSTPDDWPNDIVEALEKELSNERTNNDK